ncbi:carboxynorspermidine decarboxylase [Candidatus Micrarchaeota archaeon]|nr:carboxynorspermidine decarboxylase [Candidatus Micrarchaeota archaeon]
MKNPESEKDFPKEITSSVETPCFLVSEKVLKRNVAVLDYVQRRTGAKILLALKGFSMWGAFPIIKNHLNGVCASSPNEARLGKEEFGKEVHVFAPAYSESDINELIKTSDHIVFNSLWQLRKYKDLLKQKKIQIGLRVNPGYSEVKVQLYNPCAPGSRLGIPAEELKEKDLEGVDGLHFHAMCEQNSDVLARILKSFEKKFGKFIHKMKWVNFGGGHHITRSDYDIELLCKTINEFRKKYNGIELYLEPGEAIALNAGVLVASVLDIVKNGKEIAILDTSAEAHMPDVLAMPYKPKIIGAGEPGELRYEYRLGGVTCLAGDVIGDYSFAKPLKRGEKLVFLDMAIYTMVKTTMFNGIKHPSIAIFNENGKVRVLRKFTYVDFKNRLS